MTCNGCRAHVEKTLQEVDGVKNATVDLEKAEAVIEMEQHIPVDILRPRFKKTEENIIFLFPVASETKTFQK